jgi:RNA polymerase sigma-70 factor (ECF subfamily)
MSYAAPAVVSFPLVVTESRDAESDLVARAQARDLRAFEQLYRGHVSRVYAICLRMLANPGQAEELTQKAFIAVWDKIGLFRGESAFSSWLHRVVVNTVLAHLRAEHRRTNRIFATDNPADFETPPTPPPPGLRLDLDRAIAMLPPQARAVFVLHDVEGWQHQEIAIELGVAIGTTKAQLHRARKLLQEALQ